jgi:hypothetical protein
MLVGARNRDPCRDPRRLPLLRTNDRAAIAVRGVLLDFLRRVRKSRAKLVAILARYTEFSHNTRSSVQRQIYAGYHKHHGLCSFRVAR